MKPYVVIELGGGRASMRRTTEPNSRSWKDLPMLAEGSLAAVIAAANLLAQGEWELVTCVTPNGRLDGHGSYVKDGACAFCAKPI